MHKNRCKPIMGRGAYTQVQTPGFNLLIPQGGRRELSSHLHTIVHICTHTYTQSHI